MKEPVSVKNPMIVTSPFGERTRNGNTENHRGIDLRNYDKPVFAAEDSMLVRFGTGKLGEGYAVLRSKEYIYKYIHIAWIGGFGNGWILKEGDPVGVTNLSGTKSLHLHFEVWDLNEKKAFNPCDIFDAYGLSWKAK